MAGTEEWFRPNKRILSWGSEGGKRSAHGGLRPVARTPKPRANVPEGRSREGAPKAVYGRLVQTREAQSDDNLKPRGEILKLPDEYGLAA
jgi:hypothetical protein